MLKDFAGVDHCLLVLGVARSRRTDRRIHDRWADYALLKGTAKPMDIRVQIAIAVVEKAESLVKSAIVKNSDPLMVQSVAKAFRVLEAFDAGHTRLTLSEIAQLTAFDLSAVQRFCHTLHKLGYLDKDPVTRQFSLALKVLDLAYHFSHTSRLVGAATPVLQHLSRETEETVNLTVLDGVEVVYLSRIQSRHVLNTGVTSGTRLPAYCSSSGRAILSQLPAEDIKSVLEASDLRRHTPHTVTDPEKLLGIIEEVRQQGYASGFEEIYLGDASIAAPIRGPGGSVIGAISIATTLARFSREEVVSRYASMIIAAARSIAV